VPPDDLTAMQRPHHSHKRVLVARSRWSAVRRQAVWPPPRHRHSHVASARAGVRPGPAAAAHLRVAVEWQEGGHGGQKLRARSGRQLVQGLPVRAHGHLEGKEPEERLKLGAAAVDVAQEQLPSACGHMWGSGHEGPGMPAAAGCCCRCCAGAASGQLLSLGSGCWCTAGRALYWHMWAELLLATSQPRSWQAAVCVGSGTPLSHCLTVTVCCSQHMMLAASVLQGLCVTAQHISCAWAAHGQHLGTTCIAHGQHMGGTWAAHAAHGQHMGSSP
jgi:hypothetical protein